MAWMNSNISGSINDTYKYYNDIRQACQRIRDYVEWVRSDVADINVPLNYFKTSKVTTTPTNRWWELNERTTYENVIELKSVDELIDMLDIKIRNEFGGVESAYKNYDMIKCISKLDKIKIDLLKKLNNAI